MQNDDILDDTFRNNCIPLWCCDNWDLLGSLRLASKNYTPVEY